jgi:hypothetical protein
LRNLLLLIEVLAVSVGLSALGGCEDKPADITISQFDRPQNVAMICYDDQEIKALPLGCCRKRATLNDRDCQTTFTEAKLYAFVTQTTPGEVAVVDVEEQKIVDQERQIPYNSFIPVGGQPNDIAATEDGRRVYTANFETGDVSVIHVVDEERNFSVINRPYLSPAASIDIGGPAGKMFLVKAPEKYRDRFILVTQPTLGRLSVLALNAEDCPDKSNPDGCLLGYLPLAHDTSDPDAEPTGEAEEEIHPWAIAGSDGQSVYVGSPDSSVIWDIQTESLVARALSLESPGDIDPDQVINDVMSIAPHTTRALSLEPKRKRWLYAIDADDAKVIAIDLEARRKNPDEPVQPVTGISGNATSVVLVELEEEDEIGPYTFNGTFGVVATTNSGIAVVDVEDNNEGTLYPHPHTVRSIVSLDDDEGIPKVSNAGLSLKIDDTLIKSAEVDNYVYLAEDEGVDGGVEEECDAGAEFRPEYDNGVRFQCNPFLSKRQVWSITFGGDIGVSGIGIITNIKNNNGDPWRLLSDNEGKDFCAEELYTKGSMPGYEGDILEITSKPTPLPGHEEKCKKNYDYDPTHPFLFRIVGVSNYNEDGQNANTLEIERDKSLLADPSKTKDLVHECFGHALAYRIRAADHWIIQGSSSGFDRTRGVLVGATCSYEGATKSRMRVFPGDEYENRLIAFTMRYGEAWDETGPVRITADKDATQEVQTISSLSFSVVDGYEAMYRPALGSNITDIEFTPDNDLLLIDQAGQGLITFDLLDEFDIIGGVVN